MYDEGNFKHVRDVPIEKEVYKEKYMIAYVKWVRVLEPKYYCRNCESQIASTDKTCPKCGKKFGRMW